MNNFKYYILFTLVFISCSQDKKALYTPNRLVHLNQLQVTDTLHGEHLPIDQAYYTSIECVDSFLFLLSDNQKGFLTIYNINSGKTLHLGLKGRANNEFVNQPCFQYFEKESDGKIWAYYPDYIRNKTMVVDVLSSFLLEQLVVEKWIQHQNEESEWYYLYSKENVECARKSVTYNDPRDMDFFPPSIEIQKSKKGSKTLNPFPRIIKSDNPNTVFAAYSDIIKRTPDGKKLIQGFNFLDLINVVDIHNENIVGYKREDSYGFEKFEALQLNEMATILRLFCSDLSVTNNEMYILRDGRMMSDVEGTTEGASKIFNPLIEIIDWDGKER